MFRLLIVLAYLVMVAALPLTAGAAQTTPSLAGTSWTLSETAVQRAAPMPAVGNPRPTLTFGTDGRVSGNTGCNSFSGTYTQSGGNVTFGALAMTQALCVDQAVGAQEQLMTRVLNGTPAMTMQGNRLSFSAPAGMLTFTANAPTGLPTTGGSLSGGTALLLALGLVALGVGVALRQPTRRLIS